MKQKKFALPGVLLASLLFAMTLAGWAAPVLASSPFPVPSGTIGTITRIAGDIFTVDTGSGVVIQVRVDASTIVIKNGFAAPAALRAGDRVVVDPAFRATRPAPTGPSQDPGVRTSSGSSAQSAGDAGAGLRQSSPGGAISAAPNASNPGSGMNSNMPTGDANSGLRPASTTAQTPGDTSTTDPGTRNPVTTAHFIWVPQKDETLTTGKISAVAPGKVTLLAGSNTFTAVLAGNTDLRLQAAAGGTLTPASASNIQVGGALIIVGTTSRNSSTIAAKLVIIQPPAPGSR